MQSRLPDVNTAFILHRKNSMISLAQRRYRSCAMSLYAWNALLDTEFRIKISNHLYIEATKIQTLIVCKHCAAKHERDSIKTFNLLLSNRLQFATNKKNDKYWICRECNQTNRLNNSVIQRITTEQPHYIRIVPYPPQRNEGIEDRTIYHHKFEAWAQNFIVELEAASADYREKHWNREDSDLENINEDITGSEEESYIDNTAA